MPFRSWPHGLGSVWLILTLLAIFNFIFEIISYCNCLGG
jgi:hypothetical protein